MVANCGISLISFNEISDPMTSDFTLEKALLISVDETYCQ